MRDILVVGEDALCCALGARLVAHCLPGWRVPLTPISTGGVTKLRAALPRYRDQMARHQPVLCIADTDGACALEMLGEWLPKGPVPQFLLRLVVTEAEVWVMADREGFARAFGVPVSIISRSPEGLADPKRELLKLAGRSTKRPIRDEVFRIDEPSKPGSGYNLHLCNFVETLWSPAEAIDHSSSLLRAANALAVLR